MSSCLPLWLVKYGGAPVALVAEVDRASASRAVVIPGAAVGDMVSVTAGTGRPGVRGIVCDMRSGEPIKAPTQTSNEVEFAEAQMSILMLVAAIVHAPPPGPDIHLRYPRGAGQRQKRKRDKPDDSVRAYAGFIAACKPSGMTTDVVRVGRSVACTDIRHAFWRAASECGLSLRAIAAATGTHTRSVRGYLKNGGRDGAGYAAAFEAATLSMQDSRRKP